MDRRSSNSSLVAGTCWRTTPARRHPAFSARRFDRATPSRSRARDPQRGADADRGRHRPRAPGQRHCSDLPEGNFPANGGLPAQGTRSCANTPRGRALAEPDQDRRKRRPCNRPLARRRRDKSSRARRRIPTLATGRLRQPAAAGCRRDPDYCFLGNGSSHLSAVVGQGTSGVSRLPRRRLDLRTARGRGRPTSAASPWSARRYGDALALHCAEMEDPFLGKRSSEPPFAATPRTPVRPRRPESRDSERAVLVALAIAEAIAA